MKKVPCDTYYPQPLSPVSESFRIYGYISTVYGRVPFLLAKDRTDYKLRLGILGDLQLGSDTLCYGGECYNLPVRLEDLVFANLLRGDEKVVCEGNLKIFTRNGVEVVFKDNLPVSLKIDDTLRVSFLTFSEKGFVSSMEINLSDYHLRIVVESAERL